MTQDSQSGPPVSAQSQSSTYSAEPMLSPLRNLETKAGILHEMTSLRNHQEIRSHVDSAIESLEKIANYLQLAAPFPPTSIGTVGKESNFNHVVLVLETIYEMEEAELDSLSDDTVHFVRNSDRVIVENGVANVPLDQSGEQAKNWIPMLEFLNTRVNVILDTFSSVANRQRVTVDFERPSCRSIVAMLETLQGVIDRSLSWNHLVGTKIDIEQDVAEYAHWTAKRFSRDNHA